MMINKNKWIGFAVFWILFTVAAVFYVNVEMNRIEKKEPFKQTIFFYKVDGYLKDNIPYSLNLSVGAPMNKDMFGCIKGYIMQYMNSKTLHDIIDDMHIGASKHDANIRKIIQNCGGPEINVFGNNITFLLPSNMGKINFNNWSN